MKINPTLIRNAISMLGVDLNTIGEQIAPAIKEQLDKSLSEIELQDGESKGIVIVPNGNGEYFIVRTKFKPNANQSMIKVSYNKLSDLISEILNTVFKNG